MYRSWCRHCVASKGRAHAQSSREVGELPEIGVDNGFFGRDKEDVLPILCVKCRNSSTGCVGATVVDRKGASDYASSFLTAFIKSLGFKKILVRSDNERSLLSLIERVTSNLTGVELVLMTSPEGSDEDLEESAGAATRKSNRRERSVDVVDTTSCSEFCVQIQESWTMVERLISVDVERLGNVQWWSLVKSVHFRPVGENNALRGGNQRLLRRCLHRTSREIWCCNFPHAGWCEERNENCENDGTREMGSRVQCNVCWSSLAFETGSTESGETCCT